MSVYSKPNLSAEDRLWAFSLLGAVLECSHENLPCFFYRIPYKLDHLYDEDHPTLADLLCSESQDKEMIFQVLLAAGVLKVRGGQLVTVMQKSATTLMGPASKGMERRICASLD